MAQPERFHQMTAEEYLEFERSNLERHEFRDGQVWAMEGAKNRHNRSAMNLRGLLFITARGTSCQVCDSDTKVRVDGSRMYYYPDLAFTCERINDDLEYISSPCLIVEVLSPSTEKFDRGLKFEDYQTISSLEMYVLVTPTRRKLEVFRRVTNTKWEYERLEGDDAVLELSCPKVALKLSEIYEGVSVVLGVVEE
jgi:Uma2 family endonuclease